MALSLSTANCANVVEPWNVVVFFGQSNNVGQASTLDLTTIERATDARYIEWEFLAEPWQEPPQEQIWHQGGIQTRYNNAGNPRTLFFGPDLFAGKGLADRGLKTAILKYGHGGTSLADFWTPPNGIEYIAGMQQVDIALAAIDGPYQVRAFVFVGMETDNNLEKVNAVPANLAQLAAAVRAKFGIPDLNFVISRACSEWQRKLIPELQAKQDEYAASDPYCHLINTNGFGLIDDDPNTIHYNTSGEKSLGLAIANAVR